MLTASHQSHKSPALLYHFIEKMELSWSGHCHLQCNQWWESCNHDNSKLSVLGIVCHDDKFLCHWEHWGLSSCQHPVLPLMIKLPSWQLSLFSVSTLMMTLSNGNIFRVTGPLCGEFTGNKGRWRGALMFLLICIWINVWANNRDAGDLRHHHAHYDVTVMLSSNLGNCEIIDHQVGGGKVTRFPFSPLDVFIYISHWAAWVNSQKKPHFEGYYPIWWLTRASWCNSTGSKSTKHDKILTQNWKVILLNSVSFLDWVTPVERFFYGCY